MPQYMLQAGGKVPAFRENFVNYRHSQKSLTNGEVSGIQVDEHRPNV